MIWSSFVDRRFRELGLELELGLVGLLQRCGGWLRLAGKYPFFSLFLDVFIGAKPVPGVEDFVLGDCTFLYAQLYTSLVPFIRIHYMY